MTFDEAVAARRAGDFEDGAQIIAGLDLVITVDSSVAPGRRHGQALLGSAAPARHGLALEPGAIRLDPDARQFRQAKPGDWASVLDQVGEALKPDGG
jgi:hypothetical protein